MRGSGPEPKAEDPDRFHSKADHKARVSAHPLCPDGHQHRGPAPDPSLWYASALANALAGKDLDKANPEMVIQVNSAAPWNSRGDGVPSTSEYDLRSVFLHEMGHGLGFLSNDAYDPYYGLGSLDQPTPFDAYAQLPDGRRLVDMPSPSLEAGKAITSTLYWSGGTKKL